MYLEYLGISSIHVFRVSKYLEYPCFSSFYVSRVSMYLGISSIGHHPPSLPTAHSPSHPASLFLFLSPSLRPPPPSPALLKESDATCTEFGTSERASSWRSVKRFCDSRTVSVRKTYTQRQTCRAMHVSHIPPDI